jgi:hypothetical protein
MSKVISDSERETMTLLLEVTQALIAEGRCYGICRALNVSLNHMSCVEVMFCRNYLRKWVKQSLGINCWLEQWMVSQGFSVSPASSKQARLDWLSWMIKELQEGR